MKTSGSDPADQHHPFSGGSGVADINDVLASSPVVLYTASLCDGRLVPVWVSGNVRSTLGYETEEVLTEGWWFDHVHPGDRERAALSASALLQHQQYTHEYRFRHANGTYIRILDQIRIVMRGSDRIAVGSWTDVSDVHAQQEELEAAHAHYHRLIHTSPYAIYTLDEEGRFTELNAAAERLLGRTDLLGVHFAEVVAPEDLEFTNRFFADVMSGQDEYLERELRIRRPDGERRLLSVSVAPIRGETITGVHGIARDITEERARERQLRRAERLASVGTLVAGVAHELNNPLTAIGGFAELMLMEAQSDENREMLELTMREAKRAAKIVADLRLLARQTQYTEPSTRGPVDLNDIVAHVLKLQRYTLDTSNIEVDVDLAGDLPPVHGNAGELEQVMLNLIVNALQALEEKRVASPRITVRTRPTRGGAMLQVADNGPGIPQHDLERIFDPFFTTKSPGQGMGLGLSLVHRIIAEHDGQIQVESSAGTGAAFTVTLPRGGAARDTPAPAPERAAVKLRILVVDDEEPIRRAVLRFLRRRGHTADGAREGGDALELIASHAYDIVLTDLRMPGMGGEVLLETLRERDPRTARRVMFMTGHVARDDAALTSSYDDVPLIEKPFSLTDLARRVEELAARINERMTS